MVGNTPAAGTCVASLCAPPRSHSRNAKTYVSGTPSKLPPEYNGEVFTLLLRFKTALHQFTF